MTDGYWRSIPGLGERRAALLAEALGVRSVQTLHASSAEEIVDALDTAGSRASHSEVGLWLQRARSILKASSGQDWASAVLETEAWQEGSVDAKCALIVGEMPAIPFSAGAPVVFRVGLSDDIESWTVALAAVAEGRTLTLRPHDSTSAWISPKLTRCLYRLELWRDDTCMRGPRLQVV